MFYLRPAKVESTARCGAFGTTHARRVCHCWSGKENSKRTIRSILRLIWHKLLSHMNYKVCTDGRVGQVLFSDLRNLQNLRIDIEKAKPAFTMVQLIITKNLRIVYWYPTPLEFLPHLHLHHHLRGFARLWHHAAFASVLRAGTERRCGNRRRVELVVRIRAIVCWPCPRRAL